MSVRTAARRSQWSTPTRRSPILDEYGKPISRTINARYDAAQTSVRNEKHWQYTDNFDPHQSASQDVRKRLRERSRYEVQENNPYLKGTILTIANDFVGTGPKLQITDTRLTLARRQQIEEKFREYVKITSMRHKLWRMMLAKIVDGETFMRPYLSRTAYPIKTNYHVLETDRISSWTLRNVSNEYRELDGVRFTQYDEPIAYHVLNYHPGSTVFSYLDSTLGGQWINAENMIHWFRQDRGWLRGIPELTPSLPLCAILRRYTMATLLHKETAANHTAFIKSQAPPNIDPINAAEDDPWDVYPVNMGLITQLPWDTDVTQLEPVPDGEKYAEFVGALLREIIRPVLVTYNLSSGTSQDANMASAVLDANIYASGQHARRIECEDQVLEKLLKLWWFEAVREPGYLEIPRTYILDSFMKESPPPHRWRWDPVGLEHTDPSRVANALTTLREARILTDRDIQESRYNRDVEEWRREVLADIEFERQAGIGLGQQASLPDQSNPAARAAITHQTGELK